MMKIAHVVRERSTCARLQVGCVVTNLDLHVTAISDSSHTRILAMGYNGMEAGGQNECDSNLPGQCGCIHAEQNALIKAPPGPKALFVTTSPCLMCSRLMINAGALAVYYDDLYRDDSGILLLKERGIHVNRLVRS